MVEKYTDDELSKMRVGGHDPAKVYAAFSIDTENKSNNFKNLLDNFLNNDNSIVNKLNTLKLNNNDWINYTYNSCFTKSNIIFPNTNFLNWSMHLLDKYIRIEFLEYIDVIIGESVIATKGPSGGWIGSLGSLSGSNGFYFILNAAINDFYYSIDQNTLSFNVVGMI